MEIRDLDFANDASAMLSIIVNHFTEGFISQNDRRYCSVAVNSKCVTIVWVKFGTFLGDVMLIQVWETFLSEWLVATQC